MNIKIYNNDLPSDLDLSGEKIVALDNEALGLVLGRDPLTLVQIGLKNNNFYLVKLNRETYEAPNLTRFSYFSRIEFCKSILLFNEINPFLEFFINSSNSSLREVS